jgi:branched-chain amino acid transport system permease protein
MTLLDNVLLGSYLRTRAGFARGALRLDRLEEAQAKCEALRQLDRVGLGDKAHIPAGNLPLGGQRMLEVARALAADPVLIVLDEPPPACVALRRMAGAATAATEGRGRHHPDRRARHGLRDGPGRPRRRMDFGAS